MGLIGLFFVGAVLFVNSLLLLGKADVKGTAVMNLLVGALVGIITLGMAVITFINPATAAIPKDNFQYWNTAGTLLFSFTYFMVAGNLLLGGEGKAVGWYCLWVAIVAVPTAIINFVWFNDWRFGIIWLMWAFLWFLFFLVMALGRVKLTRFTAYVTMVEAFITCTIPAYLILINRW